MGSIVDNITTVLDALGIQGVQFVDIEPDRIYAIDRLGQLQAHIDNNPSHWFKDAVDVFHDHIEGSWRERAHPSMQACKRPISQVNPNHPDALFRWELDIDFSPTDSLKDFAEHGIEVLENLASGHLTNQDKVARLLAARFAKEQTIAYMNNPLSVLGQLPASNSPAWSINQLDFKKIGREALVALAPIIISALETTQDHRMVFGGTDYTMPIAAAVWFATQFLRRMVAGQPKA